MASDFRGCPGADKSVAEFLSYRESKTLGTLVLLYFSCYLQARGTMLAPFGHAPGSRDCPEAPPLSSGQTGISKAAPSVEAEGK